MARDPDAPLNQRRYAALLNDVGSLLDEADVAASGEKVGAFWSIGRRIKNERISQEAGYHNSVLRDLASDVGISVRNLQRAVVFVDLYPKGAPEPDGLTWTHYRALLSVPDDKEREEFRQLAIAEGLSARDLEAAIRHGLSDPEETYHLERPTDPQYVFKAKVIGIVDGDTLDLEIDLGFQTKREQRVRLAAINTPPANTAEGRKAKHFVARHVLKAASVAIKSERRDLHGRYIAHVFHSPRKMTFIECFTYGKYLNDQLLAAGHARVSR